jgi:hypothetical protein
MSTAMHKPHRNSLLALSHVGLALLFTACKPANTQAPLTTEPPPPTDTVAAAPVSWPDEPFRAQAPAARPIAELKLPSVETFKLANGLEVYLVQQNKLPTVTMAFDFDFGGISDPKDKVGLHAICMDLLDEGTQKYDTAAFEEKQADHAVNVSASAGGESSSIRVNALTTQLAPALDLMAEMMLTPGMRQADLDRIKERRKASLLQAKASPGPIAGRCDRCAHLGRGATRTAASRPTRASTR